MTHQIAYQQEQELNVDEFRNLIIESGIGKRPTEDYERLHEMCTRANLIITARIDGRLIGVARSFSDFVFCTYISDLAVSKLFQNKGIGKKLIHETHVKAPKALIILLAAPEATRYYPKLGFVKFDDCFLLNSR